MRWTTTLLLLLTVTSGAKPHGNPLVSAAVQERSFFSGAVVERLDAGPYRYLRVRAEEGDERWVATLKRPLTVEFVDVAVIAHAERFESRRLSRTFPTLFFAVVTPRKEVP